MPYDAKVTINGLETRSTGSRREFVSYGLKSGLSYKYVVNAQVVRNGQMLEDTRTVTLTAGQMTAVAFGFNTPADRASGLALATIKSELQPSLRAAQAGTGYSCR